MEQPLILRGGGYIQEPGQRIGARRPGDEDQGRRQNEWQDELRARTGGEHCGALTVPACSCAGLGSVMGLWVKGTE